MRRSRLAFAMASVLGLGAPAEAAIGFGHIDEGSARILVVKGTFEFSDDPAALMREAAAFRPELVTFHSGGGNVMAAMAYGRAIRALGLPTMQIRSADCASACTLAFMGGVRRFAEPGAIGVHQASFASDTALDGRTAVAAVQSLTAEIMGYMIEMDVDPKLLQLSLSIDRDDMRYLTAGEMRTYRVTTNTSPDALVETPSPAAPARGATPPVVSDRMEALAFLDRLHEAWSSSDAQALAFGRAAYAETVRYYGKTVSRTAVLKEKQAFLKRWPIRRYGLRKGSEAVECGATCRVEAIVDWSASSPARGKSAAGVATITLEWDPRTGRILSESSRVLRAVRS